MEIKSGGKKKRRRTTLKSGGSDTGWQGGHCVPRTVVFTECFKGCLRHDSSRPFTVPCRVLHLLNAIGTVADIDIAGLSRRGGAPVQRHAILGQKTAPRVG